MAMKVNGVLSQPSLLATFINSKDFSDCILCSMSYVHTQRHKYYDLCPNSLMLTFDYYLCREREKKCKWKYEVNSSK